MRFSLNWLRDLVEFDCSAEELAERLTMAGLELEELVDVGGDIDDIIVAEILEIKPHPNAEKLVLCTVNDGGSELPIVCGAQNMHAGDKVALAPVGAKLPPGEKLPDGLKIKKSKIRGEVSLGMLCAENELGLAQQSEGIMILPESARPGEKLTDTLDIKDSIIEVGVTPNRADCLSMVGIAREVGAILGTKTIEPQTDVAEGGEDVNELATVEVLDPQGCPRYSCRVITGVTIGPSPKWLVSRLEAADIRSINNVVDVTNYVLLEMGQPLHAFDLDLLTDRKIVVRSAEGDEKIETLDGVVRSLTTEDLVICDGAGPVALAGVMGGAATEVSEGTKNILLESAYFDPVRVRRTSKRTNLRSDSSYRFERGVDPNGVVKALARAAGLIAEAAGGEVARGAIDVYPEVKEPNIVELRPEKVNSILGTEISAEKMKEILESLDMDVQGREESGFSVAVPTFRVDIDREIDLIEEIARLYGYGKVPVSLPKALMKFEEFGGHSEFEARIKSILTSLGFLEVINYSFEDPEALSLFNSSEQIRLLNPLTAESSAMRTNLVASIMKNVVMNLNHQEEDLRIFEIGKCYLPSDGGALPTETKKLSGAATGRRGVEFWGNEEVDLFDVKGIMENLFESLSISGSVEFTEPVGLDFLHPGGSVLVSFEGEGFGFFGELHPAIQKKLDIAKRVYIFELDIDKLYDIKVGMERGFSPLPKYPSLRRDIALVVDESIAVGGILEEIERIGSPIIEDAAVFDVFRGGSVEKGKKSVAVSLTLRAGDKTLTDDEAGAVQKKVLKRLEKALGIELRKT